MKGKGRRQQRRQAARQGKISIGGIADRDLHELLPIDLPALSTRERLYRALELLGYEDGLPPEDRLELALALHVFAEIRQDPAMMAACVELAETIRQADAA